MQFIHTIEKVLRGEKSQTRRIVKPGHTLTGIGEHAAVVNAKGRTIYRVGQTLSVQPGRTAKGIARIRITGIRMEDVRNISIDDAFAEGFRPDCDIGVRGEAVCNFLSTWTKMHDPAFAFWFEPRICDWMWYTNKRQMHTGESCVGTWQHTLEAMRERPATRYTAWTLTFELVQP